MPGFGPPTVLYPLINGNRFAFSSLAVTLGGKRFTGFKAINYKNSLKPGKVRGTNAQVVGRTRGVHDASGDVTLYREDFGDFLTLLATFLGSTSGLNPAGGPPGFMEVAFDMTVAYSETPVSPVQMDVLKGCRITDVEHGHDENEEALITKLTLDILMPQYNGFYPVNVPLT